jgi:hypothetical protein
MPFTPDGPKKDMRYTHSAPKVKRAPAAKGLKVGKALRFCPFSSEGYSAALV